MKNKIRALCLGLLLLVGVACSEKVNESQVGIHYTQGPIEGEKFEDVIEPGGSQVVVNDKVYKLPARQISYHIGSKDNKPDEPCGECDRIAIRFTAKGGVDMLLEMTNLAFLNYREEALKPFFNEICSKFDNCQDEGWTKALNYAFGKPLEDLIKDIGLTYDPEKLRYDATTKEQFAEEVGTEFVGYLKRYTGRGDTFCGPGYDYAQENKEADNFCPTVEASITDVKFFDADRESVHEREELSRAEEALAQQELRTAQAQQATNAAKATPQNLALIQAEAMMACAAKEAETGVCNMTVIIGSDGQVTVPAG